MIRAFLGGSFDPVHAGHVAMAQYLLENGLADIVHVIPAWRSPHKDHTAVSAAHRLAMVRLAFAESAELIIEEREIERGKACFTVDTLASLQQDYQDDQWLLVIGGDNLGAFHKWHEPDRLQAMAKIVVLGRGTDNLDPSAVVAAGLIENRVRCVPEFDEPVSSTAVRAMVTVGPTSEAQLLAGGIPAAVAAYILSHRLYLPDWNGENLVPDPD